MRAETQLVGQRHYCGVQVVSKLAAHPGSNVRTMASDTAHGRLYTGSFDKTVKVYGSSKTEAD